jgi:predicted RNase H-like HicB family nuclease
MKHQYSIHMAWSKEDNAYIACVPELPGCQADGATQAEALQALEVIVSEWIETAREQGREIPKPMSREDHEAAAAKFQEKLQEYIKSEAKKFVQHLLKEMPVFVGGADPADYWKDC